MSTWINQHSFVVAAAAAIVVLAAVLFRDGVRAGDWLALGSLVLGLGLAYALLRPGHSTETETSRVLSEIGKGQAVLLEFQSPY
jgi:hypothetical protein